MKTYYNQFEALAEPIRRQILERLRNGPVAVGELARGLPVSRPAVSQHLRVLKEAELVRDEAIGTRRFYSIDKKGLEAVQRYLESFWDEALEAFKASAEGDDGWLG